LGAAYNSEGKVLAPEKGLPGIIADRNWKGADSLAQTHSLIGERQGTNIKFGSAEQGDIARTSRGIPDYANESVQPEEGPTLLEKPKKGYP
jgi:hypothetical protein